MTKATMSKLEVTYRKVADLIPYARNARTHSPEQVARIAGSIKEFGWTAPILVDGENGIIAGHGRLAAAQKLKMTEVPCIELSGLTDTQRRAYILADNKLALDAGWDEELLKIELDELKIEGVDLDAIGFDADSLGDISTDGVTGKGGESADACANTGATADTESHHDSASLKDKFFQNPFSVIRADLGEWQDRKREWLSMGLKSESGRPDQMIFSLSAQGGYAYEKKNKYEEQIGHKISWEELYSAFPNLHRHDGTSIFDPVLCETIYKWFCPVGGLILDPFAGGSVRGIVAVKTGYRYIGNDLRQEQIDANRKNAAEVVPDAGENLIWTCGDSQNIDSIARGIKADFLFSCPPYADLEVYSDDQRDISNMEYPEFVSAYRNIIAKSCELLKDDSFACFVVSEVRKKQDSYYGFVSDTIKAFEDAGLRFYNEAVYVSPVSSASIRAPRQMTVSRKLVRIHQNVLVFIKGDAKKAAAKLGTFEGKPDDNETENTDRSGEG